MIFVCNKWDVVKKRNEEEKVWEDTLRKIQDALPKFPEEQVFKMSATEADRYKKSNMGNTSEFGTLLDGIEKLIPKSLRAKLARHYKFIDRFLHELLTKISSRINHARKSQEDKNKLYEEVLKRLNKLNLDSDRVREGLTKTAKAECQMIVQKLLEHLRSDSVQERLMSWKEEDAPNIEADDFDVTKFKADKVIGERIMDILNEWEKEFQLLKDASTRLTKMFKEECRLLGDEFETVNVLVEGLEKSDVGSTLVAGIASSSSPRQDELFTKSEKIILAFASPLWVPLVTAASILFLPVGIGMFVRETFKASKQRKDYTENKVKYMREWTQQITEATFTEEHIGKLIFDVYFGTFERNIERVCSVFIPKQIAADQRQVNLISNDRRTSHQILEHYTPMLMNLKVIKGQQHLYELHHMTTDLIDPSEIHIEKEIGKGNFSDVYLATWKKCNGELRVALKVLRRKMKGTDMLNQLEEVDILRKMKHANIVELYGLCYTSDGDKAHDSRLSLVMEMCDDGSLENIVFENKNLQCSTFKTISERHNAFSFYIQMAVGVCDGLAEMHRKGYLHRDLKLSNVLVKHQTAKLCDLGFARMELAMTGTFVGTMTHMSPEILKNEQYTFSSDIYSLGILLWELWYGRHVYSELKTVQAFQLIDAVKTGTRPQFTIMFKPINELKDLIESCWNADPQQRPTASAVSVQLKEMFSKYHKETL